MSIVFDKKMKKNPKNIFSPKKNVFTNPHFIWYIIYIRIIWVDILRAKKKEQKNR